MKQSAARQLNNEFLNIDSTTTAANADYTKVNLITPETLLKLKMGNHLAFNAVYMAYADPMLKFLCSILRDEEDAKEVIQDVFMNLWTNRDNIDPNKNIKNYIYTATKNKAFNILRERNVRFRYMKEEFAFLDDRTDQFTHEQLQSQQIQLLIEAAILKMPPQRRRIFEMSRNQGMSHEKIAAELGITTGTVAQHITAALKSIREVLALFLILFCDKV